MKAELLTAEQARQITISQQKKLPEILEGVKSMAQNGYNYWASDLQKIAIDDELKSKLSELGFVIKISPNNFCIEW